jgi:tetratricopeptide (TPR) repeat protein
MSTVFLSYSSEQADAATRIELSLKEDGHEVFRDRSSLPPGEGFDSRIRAALEESDLLIFLISRASVSAGRYTLTELKFAEQKWGHPAGHVLPVQVEPVPKDAIPPYLTAVTILAPQGNLAAEVAAAVALMVAPWWRRMLAPRRLIPAALVALVLLGAGGWLGVSAYLERSAAAAQAGALVEQASLLANARNYPAAWEALERAGAINAGSPEVADAQERLAMDWLRNASSSQLPGGLNAIADKVVPVLSRGATRGSPQRSADLLAHLGWADHLRSRAGTPGLDPAQYYRRALAIDPNNVFAHVMLGFDILVRGSRSLAEANRHFGLALESGREREYARWLQIAGLLFYRTPEQDIEVVRVANDMRTKGEALPADALETRSLWRLWDVYYDRVVRGEQKAQFLAALAPGDHLATFTWLYPPEVLQGREASETRNFDSLFILGQLQENAGDRTAALSSYRRVVSMKAEKGYTAHRAVLVADAANAAIKRLSH